MPDAAPPPTALDTAPLVTEPSTDQVRAYRSSSGASALTAGGGSSLMGVVIAVPVVIIMIVVFAGLIGERIPPAVFLIGGAVLVALVVLGGWYAWRTRWRRLTRLALFAERNGLAYSPNEGEPGYAGAIFDVGSSKDVYDLFRGQRGRAFDVGSYRYTTGSGKNRTTHRWGFMMLRLDRRLPHMVLDSTSNNGLFGGTNLPSAFARDQVLSLEGDFDRYFRLYCPKEYERDALYVFTPNLMAELIDEASAYDVEIIDDRMFVYQSGGEFPVESPGFWRRVTRILDTVGATTVRQTDYYADDRVGDRAANVVAPQGRRLQKGIPIAGVIIAVAVVAYIVIAQVLVR